MLHLNSQFDDLKGASVFITGGGSGIGAWLTEGFLFQGAKVAFVQNVDASPFCDQLEEKYGVRPLFLHCELEDIEALEACILKAASINGPIQVLVNNAGWDERHSLLDTTIEEWDKIQNVNLRPHFFAAKAVLPGMQAEGSGSIINYSSISYMMGNAGYPGYVAAKSGITGLTRSLARELGPFNVRVNAILPGWVITERQEKLWVTPEGLEAHIARQCLPQVMQPIDLVEPTLFLASRASRMITGQALVVDAGVVTTG